MDKYIERKVWYPLFSNPQDVIDEDPTQSKLNGRFPFMMAGEVWPGCEDGSLRFICQFKHPEDQIFYRIFWDPPYVNFGSGIESVVLPINAECVNLIDYDNRVFKQAKHNLAYEDENPCKALPIRDWEQNIERLAMCCERTDCAIWQTEKCILNGGYIIPDKYLPQYRCKIGGFVSPAYAKSPVFDPVGSVLFQQVPVPGNDLGGLDYVVYYKDGSCDYYLSE